ncbi:uncharacterized protein at1g04910 [Phtheirospermum japonicum]|uniref:O-fucosyltransferase family protein n=1 Tax=Phtheirospermum japonicum TaxID=374723 RepID=A0A830CKV6_9LAMI|nr:uncharacterized protein at1g04910 [Phtheirospermum japonicum]
MCEMAVSKSNNKKKHKQSYISVPSQIINSISQSSLESLLRSPKKKQSPGLSIKLRVLLKNPSFFIFLIFLFGFLWMLRVCLGFDPIIPFSRNPCSISQEKALFSGGFLNNGQKMAEIVEKGEFWKQPDGMGYRPCLDFSQKYKTESAGIVKDRTKYLLVVVSGGINQQRNQIVDAVVIARILGAALVVPILQVNVIWGDESEFSDIFDLDHFKNVLANDVRIVSSLPSTHLMTRPVEEKRTPLHVSPEWIRSRYNRRIKRDGVLLLRGLDSRLSKDLPSDLQKLRCKVAFNALRFAPHISDLGNKLTEQMRSKGPYLALHLRMEKDVWVRTGCLPGLTPDYDEMINTERKTRPELLTSRSNMTYHERKLAGLCPLNALEVARCCSKLWELIRARGYIGPEDIALPGEIEPFAKKASVMAAVDYIVSERSDVFMASHGGNMGHAIQGHRAYAGHKKTIIPNKRQMLRYFMESRLPEAEFQKIIVDLHRDSLGQPELRTSKAGRDSWQWVGLGQFFCGVAVYEAQRNTNYVHL